jgi:hypothetical protein
MRCPTDLSRQHHEQLGGRLAYVLRQQEHWNAQRRWQYPGRFPGLVDCSPRPTDQLTIGAGSKVTIRANGTSAGVSILDTLNLSGTLDLNNNDLVVNLNTFASIRGLVLAGFGTTGPGITSSTSDGSQILALFDNGFVGATDWEGQPIGANAIVGKYTYFGDANIDGQVTGDDYTVIDANLNTTPPDGLAWLSGDMNLDGDVTGDDYTVIDANLGLGVGNPLAPSMLNAVPEPTGFAFIVSAYALLKRRRRERR